MARDILLAELTGVRYHVAHISAHHAVEMVKYAKSKGLPVTAEATPHHIALADSDMTPYDSNYKMKPPLRACGHVDAVVKGSSSARSMRWPPIMHRIRVGQDAGLRTVPVRHHRPGNGSRHRAGGTGASRQIDLMHMVRLFTTGPAGILRLDRGTLGLRRSGRRDHLLHRSRMDLRRQQELFQEPQLSVRRQEFKGGPIATIVAGRSSGRPSPGELATRCSNAPDPPSKPPCGSRRNVPVRKHVTDSVRSTNGDANGL